MKSQRLIALFILLIALVAPGAVQGQSDRFNLDFEGGTLAGLVHRMEESTRRHFNLVLAEPAKAIKVPPLKLIGVTLQEVMKTVQFLTPGMSWWQERGPDGPMVVGFVEHSRHLPERSVAVFNLSQLHDPNLTPDAISTAIYAALETTKEKSDVQIKYHKETNLLIVRAYPINLPVVNAVMRALMKTPDEPAQPRAP